MPAAPELLFWRDVPVDVEQHVFEYVARNWGEKVTFISQRDYSPERAQLVWPKSTLSQVILERSPELQVMASSRLGEPNTIHIFNGFRGDTRRYIKQLRSVTGSQWGVLAERPTEFGSGPIGHAKDFVSQQIYKTYNRRFSSRIAVFFAMGSKGKTAYEELGFNSGTLFPFMYGLYDVGVAAREQSLEEDDIVRLIYVGRLDRANKGLDMILSTMRRLGRSDFTLDIVGGYGDMVAAVQEAAAADTRINFLGPWPPEQVARRMSEYDVCVIPSRYDGWNVIVNQAINAGLACVVSDGATSDELVGTSGAGIVIPRKNQRALDRAIEAVLDSRELVSKFKQAARAYQPRIAPDRVGQYMIDVLRYSFDLDGEPRKRPSCPWLDNEGIEKA